jgi:hypothetical protein
MEVNQKLLEVCARVGALESINAELKAERDRYRKALEMIILVKKYDFADRCVNVAHIAKQALGDGE